jgi:lactoylglutathione lyase
VHIHFKEQSMQFNGFHHICVVVKDAEKSLDFYTKGLGGKVVLSFPAGGSGKNVNLVDLGNNAVIEITPRGNGEEESNAHWAHIALRTDDARAAYDLALKAGAVSRSAPNDGQLGTVGVCIAFVLGPDKEVIELFEVKA